MTLEEFAQLFVNEGCEIAYNLSDGSDSVLVLEGEVANDIANREQPRKAGDVLCFKDNIE